MGLPNLYEKYFIKKFHEWHSYAANEYHFSTIGVSFPLDETVRTGPCMRQLYYDHKNPKPKTLDTRGNLRMGSKIHEWLQTIKKSNDPGIIIEFPIVLKKKIGDDIVKIKGSVDIVDIVNEEIIDIKSASQWTMPKNIDGISPSHLAQVYLYTYALNRYVFKKNFVNFDTIKIVYVKKHNLTTNEISFDYDEEVGKEMWDDFIDRIRYFHLCLKNEEIPKKEPMKWCKYCRYARRCEFNRLEDD